MQIRCLFAAGLTYLAATAVSYAQAVPFACPKPGTVEQHPVSKLTYTGTSPKDPMICTLTGRTGKPEQRLFNLYLISDINNNPAALSPIKDAIQGLFAGQKTNITFPAMASNGYIMTETWTYLRKEPLSVNGTSFNTLVFDREIKSDPRGRSDFHGHYTYWVDPAAGLWLKSELQVISGSTNMYPQAYRVRSITAP